MWTCKCGESNLNSNSTCQLCGEKRPASESSNQLTYAYNAHKEQKVKETLVSSGRDGYYEYKVVSLLDEGGTLRQNSGKVDISAMTKLLNDLGMEGWHLVTAYANEVGQNALAGSYRSIVAGVNSTVDENILIFERFVKIK